MSGDNGESAFVVDNEETRISQLKQLAVEFATAVVGDDATALEVSVLSGGLTNQLYRVRSSVSGKSIVARVYGKETDRIISRDAELFWQSAFVRTYGRRGNALLYEFLEGYRHLDHPEMAEYAEPIAKQVAAYHVKASSAALGQLPFATEANFSRELLTKWVAVATAPETLARLSDAKRAQYNAMTIKDHLQGEVDRLLSLLDAHDSRLPQGACHNDLLSANVMLRCTPAPADEPLIKLIDFEYAKRNYLYYDIANHLNEYTGFDCDWATYFPSEKQQEAFVRAYLQELRTLTQPLAPPLSAAEEERELANVVRYVRFFMLISHICWMLWGLIQQAFSVIDFDYLTYSGIRWARYLETRDAIIADLDSASFH